MIGTATSLRVATPPLQTGPQNPASALDQLPDVSTIDARATGDIVSIQSSEAKTEGTPTRSKAILAAVTLATAAAALTGAAPAEARGWGHHHHHHGGYGGYQHYNPGAAIVGGIIGGIIGGAMQPNYAPRYYAPPPVYVAPQPQAYRDNYGNLVCPNYANGGWYVSPNPYNCNY